MTVESAADRAVFTSADDFGRVGTYTLAAGGATELAGIFVEPFAETLSEPGIATSVPAFLVVSDELPGAAAVGDDLAVGAVTYRVAALEPDGTGMTRIRLEADD